MFARVAIASIGIAAAGLMVAGCSKKIAPPPITHMAFVTGPAGFGDQGYNDAAKAGLDQCHTESGISVATVTPANVADIEPKLVLYATEKIDTVVALGYDAAPAVTTVARRFEDVHFVLIDALAAQPNVESMTFAEEQGAFLARALAALTSKTHRVAFIGGADVPLLQRSEAGFIAGAREADPRVRASAHYLASFTDTAAAHALAATLLAQGNDVLFVIAGPAGRGAFSAVTERPGAYVIGADADQSAMAPGRVLASVVKRIDAAALRACRETVSLKPAGGRIVLGVADDGIGLTGLAASGAVDASVQGRLEAIRAALAARRITAPATRAELARFVPVALP